MSPEQIRGEQKLDGRSDVFSVGVLLIELMTGSSPFRAVSPSASLAAVLEQEIDPDQRVDPQVWLVLKRAIAKRAYERFASASEFATALKRAVGATDAELQEALQRAAPARASFSDWLRSSVPTRETQTTMMLTRKRWTSTLQRPRGRTTG